jgi:hypothetical protein
MTQNIIEQYQKNKEKEKILELPSNPEFKVKIRKIPMRVISMKLSETGLLSNDDIEIKNDVRNAQEIKNNDADITKGFKWGNTLIKLVTVEPEITDELLEVLEDADWSYLVKEIQAFCQGGGQGNLVNFREQEDAAITGSDGNKVQETAQ